MERHPRRDPMMFTPGASVAEAIRIREARAPVFVSRTPDEEAARVWFEEHVRPVLTECTREHMPSSEVRGDLTMSFDEVGLVNRVVFDNLDHASLMWMSTSGEIDVDINLDLDLLIEEWNAQSDAFIACAQPELAELALPDAYELTFTWPFVIVP
jgi:hypothetical protein